MINIDKIDIEAFEADYHGAKMYHRRAEQFLAEGQCDSVIFNVASVALENYLIALCDLYGEEPRNHNYTCLMDTVETIIEVSEELNNKIRSLDLIFGICSLEHYYHKVSDKTDPERVLSICTEVSQLFIPSRIAKVREAFKDNKTEA